jgi:uncharacterized C2H2 Zn-finger protein
MIYNCDRCLKSFDQKCHYTYHINRKNPCIEIVKNCALKSTEKHSNDTQHIESDEKVCTETDKLECTYCWLTFTRQSSLNRHINNICKIKKNNDTNMEELYQELVKKMDIQNKHIELQSKQMELQKEEITLLRKQNIKIVKLEKQLGKTKIINNQLNTNTNCNNTIHNNVNFYAFGNEDYSFISEDKLKSLLNKGFDSVPKLIEYLHFNKNKPENSNVYISNIKDPYIMVFNGNKCITPLKASA